MSAAETQFTASTTPLTGISRINVDNRDTCFKSFVFDKRLQLPKSPGVGYLPLFPGSFDAVSNVRQLFEYNNIAGFAVSDNSFTYLVVNIFHPASFFARETFQCAFGTFRSFALKTLAKVGVMLSNMHYLFAREVLAFAGGRYVIKPSINTDGVTARRNDNFFLQHHVDIEGFLASVVGQSSCFRFLPFEKSQLEVANGQLDVLSASMSGDTDFLLFLNVSESPGVKGHACWLETLWWSLAFQRVGYSCYSADNVVSLQLVFLLHVVVAQVVKLYLISGLILFRYSQNIVAAVGKAFKRFLQNCGKLFVHFKFAFNCFN